VIRKRNIIATLADENFVNQAKQLFASIYFNSGWDGDYMLMSHNIPEEKLLWFKDKGIHIFECEPMSYEKIGSDYEPVILDKLYLFTSGFKKWDRVIFIDSDIIVRASLNRLLRFQGFAAVSARVRLDYQFFNDGVLFKQLEEQYNLSRKSFNTGFFVFNTDIITDDLFQCLIDLYQKYHKIACSNEESILNLYFYKNWEALPGVYNFLVTKLMVKNRFEKCPSLTKSIIYHFIRVEGHDRFRPWHRENMFYKEWNNNLNRFESIELSSRPQGNYWSGKKILIYSIVHHFYFFVRYGFRERILRIYAGYHRFLGNCGIWLEKSSPRSYRIVKRLKGDG
jgi:lipopolysaccharide biosynthesis glycosyltransferase